MKVGIVLGCLLLTAASTSLAATYVVRPDGTGDHPTIQAAIDACVNGDIVELTDGTFTGNGNRDINYLGKVITVRSQSGIAETCIIDCQGSPAEPHRGFRFDQGEELDSVLEGVTVTGGWAPIGVSVPAGGAIAMIGSSPRIENCIFANCVATDTGGGVEVYSASPVLVGCKIIGNETTGAGSSAGGVLVYSSSAPVFDNCVFSGNGSIGSGGAALVGSSCTPSFIGCLFDNNVAQGSGGGVTLGEPSRIPPSASFENCTFTGNHAVNGGGIGIWYGTNVTIVDSEFSDNVADEIGGAVAIAYEGAAATLNDCTFAGNSALSAASVGVLSDGPQSWARLNGCTLYGEAAPSGIVEILTGAVDVFLERTIIAFSTAGPAVGGPGEFHLSCCDIYGNAGGDYVGAISGFLGVDDNVSEDPLFCHPVPGDYTIAETSPCAPLHSGCGELIGAWPVGCATVGIAELEQAPATRILAQNRPNPFNPSTMITYALPVPSLVTLRIHDAAGRLVRVLQPATAVASGQHDVPWDGRDDRGQSVSSGVYYYRIEADDWQETRAMVLVK